MNMTQMYEAIYENGIFRPLVAPEPDFVEGQHVWLVVETDASPADMLNLAAQVYDGLSEEDINAVEQIALDRSHFFSTPQP